MKILGSMKKHLSHSWMGRQVNQSIEFSRVDILINCLIKIEKSFHYNGMVVV